MVAYAALGTAAAQSLSATASPFTDVPTTYWAAPFISYCAANGIINGIGDGTFNPNGNVTGFELAKMLLSAVGYGKDNEYVGSNWSINVASDAFTNGVFTSNTSANFNAPATREEAALYFFNTMLSIDKVSYSKVTGEYTDLAKTIGSTVFNLAQATGIVTGNQGNGGYATTMDLASIDSVTGNINSFANNPGTPGKCNAVPPIPAVAASPITTNYMFTSGLSDIGTIMQVYYSTASYNSTLAAYGTVYYSTTASKTVGVGDPTGSISTAAGYATAFGSIVTGAALAPATYTFMDYAGKWAPAALPITMGSAAANGTYVLYNGQIVSYSSATTTNTYLDQVTAVTTTLGAESVTLAGSGAAKSMAIIGGVVTAYTGMAVGDYVVVNVTSNNHYIITKAATVTGALAGVNYNTNAVTPYYSYSVNGKALMSSPFADKSGTGLVNEQLQHETRHRHILCLLS